MATSASIGKCAGFAANSGCVVGVASARVETTEAHDAFPEVSVGWSGWIDSFLEQVGDLVRNGLDNEFIKIGRGEDQVEIQIVSAGSSSSSPTAERESDDDRFRIDFYLETIVVESDRLQDASGDERAEFGLSHWTPRRSDRGGQP